MYCFPVRAVTARKNFAEEPATEHQIFNINIIPSRRGTPAQKLRRRIRLRAPGLYKMFFCF